MTVLARPPAAAADRGRLPVAPRDRRPALAALAVVLVLGGALASALVAFRSGDRVEVLVTARAVQPGAVVEARDLTTAQVAVDGAGYVPATAVRSFTGTVATVGIPAGTIVTRRMFLAGEVVPPGADVVGVVLSPSQRPAEPLAAGDVVRVFSVPPAGAAGSDGSGSSSGSVGTSTVLVTAALVTGVDAGGDGTAVSVLVPEAVAGRVVAGAATGQVAVARLARDTEPVVDYAKG
jgi:hypothetical protein